MIKLSPAGQWAQTCHKQGFQGYSGLSRLLPDGSNVRAYELRQIRMASQKSSSAPDKIYILAYNDQREIIAMIWFSRNRPASVARKSVTLPLAFPCFLSSQPPSIACVKAAFTRPAAHMDSIFEPRHQWSIEPHQRSRLRCIGPIMGVGVNTMSSFQQIVTIQPGCGGWHNTLQIFITIGGCGVSAVAPGPIPIQSPACQ